MKQPASEESARGWETKKTRGKDVATDQRTTGHNATSEWQWKPMKEDEYADDDVEDDAGGDGQDDAEHDDDDNDDDVVW